MRVTWVRAAHGGTTTRGGGPVPGLGRQYFDSDLPAFPTGRNHSPTASASAGSRAIPRATHPIRRQSLASWGPGSSFVRPSGEGLSHPRPDVLEKHLWLHRKYDAAIGEGRSGVRGRKIVPPGRGAETLREISLVTPLQKGSGQSEKKCRSCKERTKNGKQLSLTMSTGILGRAWASTQGLIKLCSK
jgi:hypothetical protein